MAQLGEYFPNMLEALTLIPRTVSAGHGVAHVCDPSTPEAKT